MAEEAQDGDCHNFSEDTREMDENGEMGENGNEKLSPVRYRILRTMALYMDFFAIGLSACVVGPTLVSMELLLGVTTKEIAIVFVGGSLGYTVGSLITGVLYDRMNRELMFTLATAMLGGFTILTPYTGHLYTFALCCTITGMAGSFGDAGGQAYILYLWEGHKLQGAMMQGVHTMFSAGATIGPLVVRPFLPDLSFLDTATTAAYDVTTAGYDVITSQQWSGMNETFENATNTTFLAEANSNVTGWLGNSSVTMATPRGTTYHAAGSDVTTMSPEELYDHLSVVRFAYVSIGSMILLPALLFLVTFFINGPSCSRGNAKNKQKDVQDIPEPKGFRVKFLVFGFIIFYVYLWVEISPASYLAAFVVKGLGWPNDYGSLIMTTFWGALGIGRALAIPLSLFLSPRQMLIGDMVLAFLGAFIMLFCEFHESIVWVSAAVAGLGMASFFPTAFLWASNYITITGSASSVFLVASSLGGLTGPYLVGYLFDSLGYMSLVYVIFSATIALFLAYAGAQLYLSCYIKKHGHPKGKAQDETTNLEEEKPLKVTSADTKAADQELHGDI